jgi:hypothetical protein
LSARIRTVVAEAGRSTAPRNETMRSNASSPGWVPRTGRTDLALLPSATSSPGGCWS